MMDNSQLLRPGSIINNYSVIRQIGKGQYGVVYHCINNLTKEQVAIKQSGLNLEVQGMSPLTLRELSTLYQLKSENIVNLITNFMGENCMFLVFELLHSDLQRCLESLEEFQSLDQPQIKLFMFQILKAIQLCHTRRVIHRDLKPGNIFLTKDGKLKLGDFGLSRTFSYPIKPLSEEVVTLWYRAPEILLGHQYYGPPIDIWSVGCIFGEMIFGRPLFMGQNEIDQLDKIFEIMGSPKIEYWPQILQMKYFDGVTNKYTNDIFRQGVQNCDLQDSGKDLLYRLLEMNPNKRITAQNALRHPYFAEMYK